MRAEDMTQFALLMANVMAGYGKPLADAQTVKLWFNQLVAFPPAVVEAAFAGYVTERPDFVPVPNSIVARCRLLDGRPNCDEAWSLALDSRDECETVVWTTEMAQAFLTCRAVLDAGDGVGARMAFKDSYNRLVAAARSINQPAMWLVSRGWDDERFGVAVERATIAGRLSAPQALHLALGLPARFAIAIEKAAEARQTGAQALPGPSSESAHQNAPGTRPAGLKRLLEEIKKLEPASDKADRLRQKKIDDDLEAQRQQSEAIGNQVREYQKSHKRRAGDAG